MAHAETQRRGRTSIRGVFLIGVGRSLGVVLVVERERLIISLYQIGAHVEPVAGELVRHQEGQEIKLWVAGKAS